MKKTILFLCLCYLVGVTYAQEPFRVMFYNVETVSYTHLDVYKRQSIDSVHRHMVAIVGGPA